MNTSPEGFEFFTNLQYEDKLFGLFLIRSVHDLLGRTRHTAMLEIHRLLQGAESKLYERPETLNSNNSPHDIQEQIRKAVQTQLTLTCQTEAPCCYTSQTIPADSDESTIFSFMAMETLAKLDTRTKSTLKLQIHELLFNAKYSTDDCETNVENLESSKFEAASRGSSRSARNSNSKSLHRKVTFPEVNKFDEPSRCPEYHWFPRTR